MRSDVYVSMCLSCAFVLGASMPIRVYRGCTIKHFRPVVVAAVLGPLLLARIMFLIIPESFYDNDEFRFDVADLLSDFSSVTATRVYRTWPSS